MTGASHVGERVRILRVAGNLSQTELGRAIGNTGNGFVSRIESGRQPVDSQLTGPLADALSCTPEFLQRPLPEILYTRPWLRAYADAPAKTVESVIADNQLVAEAIEIMQLRTMPDRMPHLTADPNDDAAIEAYADEVRAAADLDEGAVVGNAVRAAERLGCVVLPLASELGRHLGLSQRLNGRPYLRVSRPGAGEEGVPGDRQRFTVLHEVGHLALHADLPPPDTAEDARRIERQAHRFASAFLTPADPLLSDWQAAGGRMTLSALADLKATWGISIKALVVRFQQLGVVGPDQATALYKQISKRGWNTREPVRTTNEEPIWLSRAIGQRAAEHTSPVAAAAAGTGLSESRIRAWLDWSPAVSSEAKVFTLPTRNGARAADSQGDHAQILPLARRN